MRMLTSIGLISIVACQNDKSITVQNPAPKADVVSHGDGDVVLEGMPTVFVGSVTDSNHTPDQLTTIWYVNGEIVCDGVIPNENGETTCELALGLDDTEITLAVRDPENARNDDTIVVNIEPTEAPQAEILTPVAGGIYYADQKITFEGMISDAEDASETLSAYWESDIDGVLSNVDSEPDSTGTIVGYEYLTEGEHAIELHVEDSTGKTDRETVIINVGPPNSAPLCEILTPVDGSAGAEGSLVTFTGTTSDVDVAPSWLSVAWSSDKDGDLGTSTPNSDGTIGFAFSNLTVDTHTITLTVTDEVGAICTDSIFFTVGTPPSITIDSPIDGSVLNEGEPISFTATVSDAQDQPDAVALDWVANGNNISTQGATSSGTATFSDSTLTYGSYNLVVTATDSDGLTDSDQINFTVNGVPSAPVVSINPNTPTTSDGLNVSIDSPSVDPEGVTPIYTYEWQLGGQTQTAYTSSSLPSSATSKGEQWTVLVTPNDGIVDGIAGTASVAIGNTTPSVGSVLVTPSGTVYNDDVLTCSASVTDPDETPTTTYEWTIGGGVVGSNATLDLSGSGAIPGDAVVCTVTATDSDSATDSNSGSQTVGNRSPSITASISTNGTNQNAELICTGTATDPDGETPIVTYEWFNGSNSLGTSNPLQLNSTMASSGDVIECIATATDAMGGTDTVTVSHTVTNTAPVISSVSVTPDPATIGQDDLTCTVSASDADGDSLLYSYEWSDSSGVQQTTTLVADTSDVFLTSGLTEDTWTCEVTPYDGTDYGLAVSDSTSVVGGCASLDFGPTGQVVVPNDSVFDVNNTLTLSSWIYLYDYGPNNISIFNNGVSSGFAPSYALGVTGDLYGSNFQGYVRFSAFSSQSLSSSVHATNSPISNTITDYSVWSSHPLSLHQWYHVAVVYDVSTVKIYINGIEDVSVSANGGDLYTPVHDLWIGDEDSNVTAAEQWYLPGYLQSPTIWSTALTSSEVSQLVTNNTIPTNGLIASWGLNQGLGMVAIDSSGNSNDGSINGASWVSSCPEEDLDGDGYPSWDDCNDNNASIHPYAGDVYGDGIDSDCDGFDCEAGYDGSGTYFNVCVLSTQQDYAQVETHCLDGGHDGVALPLNSTENDTIFQMSLNVWANRPVSNYSIRLGGTDAVTEDVWLHDRTGAPMTYFNWPSSGAEPNNGSGNEHCINIIGDIAYNGLWQDLGCHAPSNAAYAWSCETR